MTYTEIDPTIVREIAEVAFRSDAGGDPSKRVEAALIASGVAGPVVSEKFDAWSKAVGAEYERLAVAAATRPDASAMSNERLAELDQRITNGCNDGYDCNCDNAPCGLEPFEARELLAEVKRARAREAALVNEVDEQAEQLRRISAELARCADLNRDLVATNTNLAEMLKEAREQIRDRDYINAQLRKTIEEYRARLAEVGEPARQWTSERQIGRLTLYTAKACDTKAEALEIVAEDIADGIKARLVQRILGPWCPDEQGEA